MNGVGGKFEEGEDCYKCIVSEVQEESGLIDQGSRLDQGKWADTPYNG